MADKRLVLVQYFHCIKADLGFSEGPGVNVGPILPSYSWSSEDFDLVTDNKGHKFNCQTQIEQNTNKKSLYCAEALLSYSHMSVM